MSGRATAATRLERALVKHAAAAGVGLTIDAMASTRWASATFVGARHRLELVVAGDGAELWLEELAEADLPIPGHLVADVAMIHQRHSAAGSTATAEMLTVEDGG
ncbi:hypothetical protein [uncultured Sphingomonas sp.]|uniref:hypothetical protein n=1 Tax=uncultured Sphingomonas sp. TaxID=158754 RepID=UPI00374A65B7